MRSRCGADGVPDGLLPCPPACAVGRPCPRALAAKRENRIIGARGRYMKAQTTAKPKTNWRRLLMARGIVIFYRRGTPPGGECGQDVAGAAITNQHWGGGGWGAQWH